MRRKGTAKFCLVQIYAQIIKENRQELFVSFRPVVCLAEHLAVANIRRSAF
jgi:hypothetical protein